VRVLLWISTVPNVTLVAAGTVRLVLFHTEPPGMVTVPVKVGFEFVANKLVSRTPLLLVTVIVYAPAPERAIVASPPIVSDSNVLVALNPRN
jgi:hypothetical protein